MSYRCGICTEPVQGKRRVHRLTRMRTERETGQQSLETSAEVPVCDRCQKSLQNGIPYRMLLAQKAPKDLSAPPYRVGESRPVFAEDEKQQAVVIIPVDQIPKAEAVAESVSEKPSPEVSRAMFDLFRKYGARSYWISAYVDMPPAKVAAAIAEHFHLRRLYHKIIELVPKAQRRQIPKPTPSEPVLNGRDKLDTSFPLTVANRLPKPNRKN